MNKEVTINHIREQIDFLAKRDQQANGAADQKDMSALLESMNLLASELEACSQKLREKENRINALLDNVVRYSTFDFSIKNDVSDKGDVIDALCAGLNVMAEELQSRMEKSIENEQKIASFLKHAPDAVIVINSEGRITAWNPAAEAIFGWEGEEVNGRPIHELIIPEEYRQKHLEGMSYYLRTGIGPILNKTIQLPALRKDGSTIDIELTVSSAKFAGEGRFIAFLRDVSDKKRSEEAIRELNSTLEWQVQQRTEALRRSEEKYRLFFESSPLPMWLLELPSHRFVDVNESAIKHYGYTREEFLSMTAVDIRPEEEKEKYINLNREGPLDKKTTGPWKHLRKDGSIIHVEINVHDIEFKENAVRLVIVNDVTEKIKYEEALRQSESRFRRIFDSQIVGFIFWKASGEIVDANDRFLEIVGYTRSDLESGKINWPKLTPPEFAALDRRALEQIEAKGVCDPFEKVYLKKDGTPVYVRIGAASLAEGDKENGVAYVMDITYQKKIENDILELNKELEEKVRVRTEQLEMVNKELESFSYSVSHDLRAPLRAINGFSKILTEDYKDKLDEEGIRLLNIVMKNATKMGSLIDELLAFSRLGKKTINKTKVNLDKVVEEVVAEINQSQQHDAQISQELLGFANADYTLIKQVYQNLLTNAIKYSSKTKMPQIQIGMIESGSSKTYFVKDNGAGFDMIFYDKLFGVFQRLHRQEEFEGIGVGLALVQRIITRHGGKVWAEAKPGEGATFYFTLEN